MNPTFRVVLVAVLVAALTVPSAAGIDSKAATTHGRSGPDLTVEQGSYAVIPDPPRVQDTVTVNVTVINRGDDDAGSFVVAFYLNNTTRPLNNGAYRVTVNSLAAGAAANVSCTWNTQTTETTQYFSGINYTILVLVDSNAAVNETDENNNLFAINQTLGPERLPDLVLSGFSISPPGPVKGDVVQLIATITNIGEAAGKFFRVWAYANDIDHSINYTDVGMLNVSEVQNVTVIWNTSDFSPGYYNIYIYVNPEFLFTRIAEPDWSNNNGSKAVVVSPPVLDLALVSLDIEPSEVHEGDLMTVNCTIRNNGDRTAENLTVRLLFDDEPLFGRATDLQAGDTFSFATQNDTSTYEPGDHVLRLVAGNINSSRVITLLGIRMADLVPQNLSFSPQRPDVDQPVLISLDVVNAGSAPAGPCRLSLFLDYNNTEVTGEDVPALDPGAGDAVSFLWNTTGITAGAHWLRLLVDSGFDVIESNETNNTIVWSVGFSGVMDLAMDTVTVAPSGPRTGDIVQFSAKVMNIGSIPSGAASVTLKVNGSAVDVRGLGALDPKTSRNATLWWNTAGLVPGLYEYEVVVSSTGSATDADNGNNNLTGLIDLLPHIPGPDLRVGGINISPPSPRVGDELVLSITVQNIGNLDSRQCSLMVYLETGLAFLKFTDVPVLLPPIPAGGSLQINASRGSGSFGAGSYTINVTVDYRNELAELNETNNNFLVDFQLLPQIPKAPVLGVGSVTVDGKLREGSTLNILAVVTNTGDADALGVNVTLIIDNEPAGRLTLDVISAGSNRTATFAWKPTSGTHTIQVKAETEDAPQATGSMQTVSITGKPAGGGGGTLMLGLAAVVVIVAAAAGAGVLLMRRKKGSGPG